MNGRNVTSVLVAGLLSRRDQMFSKNIFEYLGFLLSLSFYHSSILVFISAISDAKLAFDNVVK